MTAPAVIFGVLLAGQAADVPKPLEGLCREGVKLGGRTVVFEPPVLPDGAPADAEKAALRAVAGSDRDAAELTRDSITAPVVTRTTDLADGGAGVVRVSKIFFVVRADLDEIDPARLAGGDAEGTAEAGNMKFTTRRLVPAGGAPGGNVWYVHTTGLLLSRIRAESTDRVSAEKGENSWLIVGRTDPKYDGDEASPNLWLAIAEKGGKREEGKPQPYPGHASYVKVTPLTTVPGALLVETHSAFYEPKPWFDGAPTLRSKIGLVAQDRVRKLRRELAKSHKAGATRSSPGPDGG